MDSTLRARPARSNATRGMMWGLLGILCFSITLPATKAAVASLDPMLVGFGRALLAATISGALLLITRQPLPEAKHWRGLALLALGAILIFPAAIGWAMQRVPAAHGAVVLGLLPLATAVAGAMRTQDRPSVWFWIVSATGSLIVIGYALSESTTGFQAADLALLAAVISAAVSYAEGTRLGRQIGTWQVMCWALIMTAPLLLGPVCWLAWKHGLHATTASWIGFLYAGTFSALLGFFPWYRGLALGGVARVGQVQLLQPFFTLAFASLFLGEAFHWKDFFAAFLVSVTVAISRRCVIR